MKKNLMRTVALFAAMVMLTFALSSCDGGSASPAGSAGTENSGETYTLKIANQWADSSVHTRMFTEVFIPRVEELSNGQITCEFYGNNSLGNEIDQLAQLQIGTLQMAILSEQSSSLDPGNLQIPCLPFLFESEAHWDAVMDGEIGEQIVAGMVSSGVRTLGITENGYRVMTNNVHPINTPEDIKDLKMRVSSNETYLDTFATLGASCQSMTIGECYSALETGSCDGQDNAYNTILSARIYEVQKYLANTNHVLGTMYLAVSDSWYQSLPEELQTAVQTAATEACQWQRETYRELAEQDHQALLDAGLEETNPDLEPFKEATEPVYDHFFEKYPETEEIVEAIRAMA